MIPDFRNEFRNDLIKIFRIITHDGKKATYIPEIETSAIMYSCSICIEFKEKAGFLSFDYIQAITEQVCDVISSFFSEFDDSYRSSTINAVSSKMDLPNIKKIVDDYQTELSIKF